MWPLIIGGALIYGAYEAWDKLIKKDVKPKLVSKKKDPIPLSKLPSKIAFSDDIKEAKKSGWKTGAMPMDFRHYWLWSNGKWKEITKDEYMFLHTYSGGHDDKFEYSKKKTGMEAGKHVSYKTKQSQ